MSTHGWTIQNARGERLDVAAHEWSNRDAGTVALLAHGVTGNKDRPWLVALAEALAAQGIPALRFSFSGNGESEGRFEDATLTKEVEDLGSVIDAVTGWGATRVAYVGHSMGGAIGVLQASTDARLSCLVSLGGMFHVAAFMERQFGGLRFGEPMLGKPECPWNEALARDAARIGSLTSQAAAITAPWLLVHGDADELVPYQDALDARAASSGCAELVTLAGVDHRFTDAVPAVVDAVVPWLTGRLRL